MRRKYERNSQNQKSTVDFNEPESARKVSFLTVVLLKNFNPIFIFFLKIIIIGALFWKIFERLSIIYEATQYN